MIFGLSVLGVDNILTNTLSPKADYEYLKVNGNLVVDALSISDIEYDDSTILGHFTDVAAPAFDTNSVLVANFNSSLEAGSLISSVPYPLSKYIIRRKEVGDSLNPILIELTYDQDLSTYIDYTAKNNTNYTYGVYPLYSDGTTTGRIEGTGVEGNSSINFYAYILTDLTNNPTVSQYVFTMDNDLSDIDVVTSYEVFDNYTQFPAIHFENQEYRKTRLTTMPFIYQAGQGNGGYVIDQNLLDDIIDFLNNKNSKVFRLPSGEIWECITNNVSCKYLDNISGNPWHISFDIVQIADI